MDYGMTINDFYKNLYKMTKHRLTKCHSQKYKIIYDPCYFNDFELFIPKTIFDNQCKFTIVPLCIFKKSRNYFHYNLLIVDNDKKIVERFEPVDMKKCSKLDEILKKFIENNHYIYCFQKYRGPQWMEMMEVGKTMNCGWWILMYIEKRLEYQELISETIISNWMKELCYYGYHKQINEYKNQFQNEMLLYQNYKFVKEYDDSNYIIIY
jgi:hypothetical protein